MRKIIILVLSLFVLTGCSSSVDIKNIDSILETFLNKSTSLVNNYSNGYKYYLPSGVRVINSDNYNEKLYYNGYYYYLFVDVASYYYKTDVNYNIDSNLYYSNTLEYNGIKGYAEIEELDDLYRVKVYYNYSSIETYVDYDNLGQSMINICYILNSNPITS